MGYALPPRPCGTRSHPKMRRNESVDSIPLDLEVFLTGPRARARRPAPNVREVSPASGYDHRAPRTPSCCHEARARTELPRVLSPSTYSGRRVYAISRACLTRYAPPSGLLTLLTVSSATTPASLFHPADVLGFDPSEPAHEEQQRLPACPALLTSRCSNQPAATPRRQPSQNHGSNEAVRRTRRRSSRNAAFRAFLPSETRTRVAAV